MRKTKIQYLAFSIYPAQYRRRELAGVFLSDWRKRRG
jgi:hypothetical protein